MLVLFFSVLISGEEYSSRGAAYPGKVVALSDVEE